MNSLKSYNHVVVTLWKDNDYTETTKKHPYYCLHYKGKLDTFRTVMRLKQLIKKHNVSILHSHLLVATSIARLAKSKSIKFIFSVHGELSKGAFKISKLSKLIEKLTYSKKQTALFVSNIVKKDYDQSIGLKGKFHVLYNFIEDVFFVESKPIIKNSISSPAHFHFISLGKLKDQKNHSMLIKVFSKLDPEKYKLDIYGDGPLEKILINEIKTRGAKNIVLKGKVKNVPDILSKYHYFVLTSLTEGYGLAPLEAMSSNIPCLLSDLPIFQELVPNCAIFFDPTSEEDLIKTIEKLNPNSQSTIDMISRANARVKKIASKQAYIPKLESIYNSL